MGNSAMCGLCFELGRFICGNSVAASAWCKNNGLTPENTGYINPESMASMDIDKRIVEAKERDADSEPVAVTVKREFSDKAAQLDALRKAGRIMPEGINWPQYDDGTSVLIGDYVTVVRTGVDDIESETFTGYVSSVLIDEDGWNYASVECGHGSRSRSAIANFGDTFVRCERDSWEKLESDAKKFNYWNCPTNIDCKKCDVKCGMAPKDFYGTEFCADAKVFDIINRAKKLAGVE